jgi:hypothetical protein
MTRHIRFKGRRSFALVFIIIPIIWFGVSTVIVFNELINETKFGYADNELTDEYVNANKDMKTPGMS